MESDHAAKVFALPARRSEQTLHGYVRQHLQLIEQALSFGVPYTSITEAARTAGFAGTSVHTMEQAVYRARRYKPRFAVTLGPRDASESLARPISRSPQAPPPLMKEDMAAMRKRFQELARPPKSGERDPLD